MNQYLMKELKSCYRGPVKAPLIHLILLLLAFGMAGTWDYEDALRQQEKYCEMVSLGVWGDYNGNYDEICKGEHDSQASSPEGEGEE